MKKIFKKVIFVSIVPIVLIMRFIRPILFIRIGRVRSDRIGHLAGNMDRHLCIKKFHNSQIKSLDFYYVYGSVSNNYLCNMWSRSVNIAIGILRYPLYIIDTVNHRIPGGVAHTIDDLDKDRDNHNLVLTCPSHLNFLFSEEKQGNRYLESKNVSKSDEYICFCARDSSYLNSTFPEDSNRWSYHEYRNANILAHVNAVKKFLDKNKNFKAFRMGSIVNEDIKFLDDRIVDYSCNGDRTEFLDLFLSAKCKIFLNSGSGLDAVPRVFRTPMIAANLVPLNYIGSSGTSTVVIPKKYWLIKEKKFMSFKEIIQSDVGKYLKSEDYINHGIELIENTVDDIYYALIEANERIDGKWSPTDQDLYLQEKFQSLFLPDPSFPSTRAPISAKFLEENSELLV